MEQLNRAERRRFKDELYAAFATVGSALASAKRLEMLDLLAQRAWPVQELADEMGISVANASQHLQTLLAARLVTVRREGTYAYYHIADAGVLGLWRALRELAHDRLPEVGTVVERHLGERGHPWPGDATELGASADRGDVLLLDVRPADEYAWGHLPNAVSIPVDEVTERVDELPRDRPIVVYCRGPFCTYSDEAVTRLRLAGLEAFRLEPGVHDWRALGLTPTPTADEQGVPG